MTNALFDRCYVSSYFHINSLFKNVQIVNSVIYCPRGSAANIGDVFFSNCNILCFYSSNSIKATFINSIVLNYSTYKQESAYFSYCFLRYDELNITMQNCKAGTFKWSNTYQYTPDMTGTDGTVVGINGGTTPFTLVPSNPKVNNYSLKVDTQKKQLTVNIKVSAN